MPRTGLLSVALMTSGAGLLSAFSPNYIILVILRFFVGVGLGGGPVYTSWFLEFVPVPNRGVWMVVFSTFWTVGTIIEASLGWVCSCLHYPLVCNLIHVLFVRIM